MGSFTTPRQPLCLCLTPDTNSLSSWQMPHVHLAQALWKAPQDKNLTHVGAHQTLRGLGPSLFPGSSLASGLQVWCWRHHTCAVDELSFLQHPSPLPTVPFQEAFFPGTVSMLPLWAATAPAINWNQPGGLPSLGSLRVGHDWSDLAAAADC